MRRQHFETRCPDFSPITAALGLASFDLSEHSLRNFFPGANTNSAKPARKISRPLVQSRRGWLYNAVRECHRNQEV